MTDWLEINELINNSKSKTDDLTCIVGKNYTYLLLWHIKITNQRAAELIKEYADKGKDMNIMDVYIDRRQYVKKMHKCVDEYNEEKYSDDKPYCQRQWNIVLDAFPELVPMVKDQIMQIQCELAHQMINDVINKDFVKF